MQLYKQLNINVVARDLVTELRLLNYLRAPRNLHELVAFQRWKSHWKKQYSKAVMCLKKYLRNSSSA